MLDGFVRRIRRRKSRFVARGWLPVRLTVRSSVHRFVHRMWLLGSFCCNRSVVATAFDAVQTTTHPFRIEGKTSFRFAATKLAAAQSHILFVDTVGVCTLFCSLRVGAASFCHVFFLPFFFLVDPVWREIVAHVTRCR